MSLALEYLAVSKSGCVKLKIKWQVINKSEDRYVVVWTNKQPCTNFRLFQTHTNNKLLVWEQNNMSLTSNDNLWVTPEEYFLQRLLERLFNVVCYDKR